MGTCYSLVDDEAFIELKAALAATNAALAVAKAEAAAAAAGAAEKLATALAASKAETASADAQSRARTEAELESQKKVLADAEAEALKAAHLAVRRARARPRPRDDRRDPRRWAHFPCPPPPTPQACLTNLSPHASARAMYRMRSGAELLLREALAADGRETRKELVAGAVDAVANFDERRTHGGEWRTVYGRSACAVVGQIADGVVCCMHSNLAKTPHWTCCGKTDEFAHCSNAHAGEWRDVVAQLRLPTCEPIKVYCATIASDAAEGVACCHEGTIEAPHWSCCGSTSKFGGDHCELFFPIHPHPLEPTHDTTGRFCGTCFSEGDGHFASCKQCNYVRDLRAHARVCEVMPGVNA
jgi:hypothetical protein